MELFGTEVISRFDNDEVHSTTRYRQAYAASVGGHVPGPVDGLDVE